MHLSMKQKQTHRLREQTWPGGEGGGSGRDWEFGISRCKLLCIEWINNKILLCSTGNSTQHPVINHDENEYKKEYNGVTTLGIPSA